MHLKNKKLLITILLLLIVVVNCITVCVIVNYFNYKNVHSIFEKPDFITISNGEISVDISPDDESFNDIVDLNSKRSDETEFLVEYDTVNTNILDDICIIYNYNKRRTILVDMLMEQATFKTKKISFILTGKESSQVHISIKNRVVVLGALNSNSDLTNLVKEILNNN